ncbi:gliding motility-associated C-terminal domain-containing protein [Chitinophaga nivalis]|uniref:Gliding motility-associated C-terminal domain-containing protein n=1 Tax=Chitinophaga nivalis TaxID=2991709 RepID=A0ABT3IHV3_9BACT|nr:gliding motility-associated C-terminal domain-containing protein [Chitinophaga nivalis]MCW3466768.1 gliding motility-associated C-terminal domain-containing protein [Chitinophaga nivalis]MCW3483541.1 gliding motility-associated C-terminal domain-containing protein [Chitinophaga nivalis]
MHEPVLSKANLLLFLCLLFSFFANAQEGGPLTVRPCGADAFRQVWRKDAAFLQREEAINKTILQQYYQKAPGAAAAPAAVVLPVVFHIINEDPAAFPDPDVLKALQRMNEAFGATGAFTGGRTDTRIQFCLAKTAPDGSKTTGIVRTHSYLSDFDVDMEGSALTALGKWDGSRYINIWVVTDIKSEYMQGFECGKWSRMKMGGYASAGGDIVVAGLDVGLLAHEMGHYLSLAHTFAAGDCKNDDCLTDGDMVCDTPPEKTIAGGYACNVPQNSCSTDTLSGFTIDVPDLPDNIMDYGQGLGCILSFTAGQAQRMHHFITTGLSVMLTGTVCQEPCTGNITAAFSQSKDYPVVGDVVTFSSTGAGEDTYEWLVDDVPKGTGHDLVLSVTQQKNYRITLRVTNTVSNCHAAAYNVLSVTCGVVARFYPDKRKIASRQGIELDSVKFTNRSRNATAWSWLISSSGMAEQVVSTQAQLTYVFKQPGIYKVRLAATDGHCHDTTQPVNIIVDDPVADGAVYVTRVECFEQDKVRISLYFHNFGYHTIPKGTPVSFYDADPRKGNANKLGQPWLLPADLLGKCSSILYTTTATVGRANLDTLVTVFCDAGNVQPFVLPNTPLEESNYNNNIDIRRNFKFEVHLQPADYTLQPQDKLVLKPAVTNGQLQTAVWAASPFLDCTACINTTFTAPYRKDTVTTQLVTGYSQLGCYDTATAKIHVPVVDDYKVTLQQIECAKGDNLHVGFSICNGYTKGNIPARLTVDFYDRNPVDPAAVLLNSGFMTPAQSSNACADYGTTIKATATGDVFAIVNKRGGQHPPETGLNETDAANNTSIKRYQAAALTVYPRDTTVFRKALFPAYYHLTGFTPKTIKWQNDDAYTLSCYQCPAPRAAMRNSAVIGVQLTNPYGCELKDQQLVKIYPPDFTMDITDISCYDNNHVLVKFRICTANGYDSIPEKLPVTFYDGIPGKSNAVPMEYRYYTPVTAGECREFTHILSMPRQQQIGAVINQGTTNVRLPETNYKNNEATANYTPFSVTLNQSLITLPRPAATRLFARVAGSNAATYTWTPQSGLSCITCPSPVAAATSSMQYTVTAANEYYCTDTASVYIQTFISELVAMPNAFTPNGDGQNDVFYIIGRQDISMVKDFTIFNRSGNRVFEVHNTVANDRRFGWNGQINGVPAPIGTYVYFASIALTDGSVRLIKGTVTVVR